MYNQCVYKPTKVKTDDRDTAFTGAIKQVNCIQNADKQESNRERKYFLMFLESLIYHQTKCSDV